MTPLVKVAPPVKVHAPRLVSKSTGSVKVLKAPGRATVRLPNRTPVVVCCG